MQVKFIVLFAGFLLILAGCGTEVTEEVGETAVTPTPKPTITVEPSLTPTNRIPLSEKTDTPTPTSIPPTSTRPPIPTLPYPTPIWLDALPQPLPVGVIYGDADGVWQTIASGQGRQLWDRTPVTISPDGQYAFYHDGRIITVVNLLTGVENRLDLSDFYQWACPVWGGDDMILLGTLMEDEEAGQSCGHLTAIAHDGSWQTILTPEQHYSTNPSFSPNDDSIAYDGHLIRLDRSTEIFDPTTFDGFPPVKVGVRMGSPDWSPDGEKLAWYIAGNIGEYRERKAAVAVFDLEAETAVILHPYINLGRGGWFAAPVWSPDGRWLAFRAEDADFTQNGIWIVAADGSEEHFMGGPGTVWVWSPDSRYLVYSVWDSSEQKTSTLMADTETWTAVPLDLPSGAGVVGWESTINIIDNE